MSKIVASNHKGYRDYAVIESLECGIELKGSEVKSVRQGKVNLNDSFARLEAGELILYNTHISPYTEASYMNVEPTRKRRLLLHRNQLEKLEGRLTQKGLTLIPLKVYFNDRGFVKIELALCKGKKLYDKRDDIKRRETDIAMRRALRRRR
ncbi:MAG: SsrA-binding protein SmpB [Candidatus Omnitrophica bacterium]|nr:SsrA-binding protein SmpB [Candidatus Omnitrophota bacterium]